jgi:hypothetical protein
VTAAEGEFTVERWSPELARPVADLAMIANPAATVRGAGAGAGTPLHATAYPYVLLVLLLVGEWVLRRRWGLR